MVLAVRVCECGRAGRGLRAPQGGAVVKLHGGLGAHLRTPLEPGGTALQTPVSIVCQPTQLLQVVTGHLQSENPHGSHLAWTSLPATSVSAPTDAKADWAPKS